MRRDVSSHGYGICTAQQLYRFAEALGADKRPWVQAYCLIVGASKRGNALDDIESAWLEDWISREGMALEPREAIVSQFSIRELTSFFGGQKTIAIRALDELQERGLIEQIAKGRKGHSSLFLIGDIQYTKSQKKSAQKAKKNQDTFSDNAAHVSDKSGHKPDSVTSGNNGVLMANQYVYPALSSDGHCLLCNECGYLVGRNNRFGRYECHGCNGANVGVKACGKEQCGACDFARHKLCA